MRPPSEPGLTEKRLPVWQLYGWGWQAVAEDVLNQRADTAQCLQDLRDKGIIK